MHGVGHSKDQNLGSGLKLQLLLSLLLFPFPLFVLVYVCACLANKFKHNLTTPEMSSPPSQFCELPEAYAQSKLQGGKSMQSAEESKQIPLEMMASFLILLKSTFKCYHGGCLFKYKWSFHFLLLPRSHRAWQDLSWKSTLITIPVLHPACRQKVRMEEWTMGKKRTSNNSEHTFPHKNYWKSTIKFGNPVNLVLIFFSKLSFFLFSLPIWVSF